METQVRPCPNCADVLDFDEVICPCCGVMVVDSDRPVKPCLKCEALVDAEAQYCDRCGGLTVAVEGEGLEPGEAFVPRDSGPRTADEWLVLGVAGLSLCGFGAAIAWVLVGV